MGLLLRKATKEDLPQILDLVQELADYEKEPEAVTATLVEYEENLGSIFNAILAVKDDKVVGMVLYYLTFSTWKGRMMYLEDFVVKEEMRRIGIGEQLFDALLVECEIQKVKLLKWQVLDWNTPAIRFYEKYNYNSEGQWLNGKIFFED